MFLIPYYACEESRDLQRGLELRTLCKLTWPNEALQKGGNLTSVFFLFFCLKNWHCFLNYSFYQLATQCLRESISFKWGLIQGASFHSQLLFLISFSELPHTSVLYILNRVSCHAFLPDVHTVEARDRWITYCLNKFKLKCASGTIRVIELSLTLSLSVCFHIWYIIAIHSSKEHGQEMF